MASARIKSINEMSNKSIMSKSTPSASGVKNASAEENGNRITDKRAI